MKDAAIKSGLRKFLFNRFGVRLSDVLSHFNFDSSLIAKLLDELVLEGWIIKSYCGDDGVIEYDPGSLQGY